MNETIIEKYLTEFHLKNDSNKAYFLVEQFLQKYPIDHIKDLSMSEFIKIKGKKLQHFVIHCFGDLISLRV